VVLPERNQGGNDMKQIGTTSTGHALVEIASATAVAIVAALKQMGEALTTLDSLLTLAPSGHPVSPLLADAGAPPSSEAAGNKRAAVSPMRAPAKDRPGRECATRSASGDKRQCEDCQKPFTPWRKDQRFCSKCSKHAHPAKHPARVAAMKQARKYAAAMPPVPGKPPASSPEADDAKARRLSAIRAADARLKAKGIYVPDTSDSGIREASEDEIAAVRGNKEE
jgi:hypothetical protein